MIRALSIVVIVWVGMAAVRPRVNIYKHYTITNVPEIVPVRSLIEQYLSSRVANENTRRSYGLALRYFAEYCQSRGVREYADVSKQIIADFKDARLTIDAPATVRLRLDIVKAFCAWMQDRYFIYNPARGVRSDDLVSGDSFKGLTAEEVSSLIARAKSQSDPLRRFIPLLLLETGLRCSEARDLLIGQISEDGQWFRYVLGKNKKRRHVPIVPDLAPELQTYMSWRRSLPAGNQQPLLTCGGGATARTVQKLNNKTIYRISIEVGDANPHRYRHAFTCRTRDRLLREYSEQGLDPATALNRTAQVLQAVLGHSSWQTTLRYLQLQNHHFENAFHGGIV